MQSPSSFFTEKGFLWIDMYEWKEKGLRKHCTVPRLICDYLKLTPQLEFELTFR